MLDMLEMDSSDEVVMQMFQRVDKDSSGGIDLAEFSTMVAWQLQLLKYSRILRPTTQQAAVRIAARTCGDSCAYPQ